MDLIRPTSSIAWELRTAWATGRRVSLTLERADLDRLEGHVSRVAATNAYVAIAGLQVPLDRVLAVHVPSRLGDSTVTEDEPWRGCARRLPTLPGQGEIPGIASAPGC
jgi:hypothetical protein